MRLMLLLSVVLAGSIASARTSEKIDLDRVKPVAANEQIPISDFFRPAVLDDPAFNPAGTHVASIASLDDDNYQLLVYNMKTKKTEVVGGPGNKEIFDVNWVSNKRLMFYVGVRNESGAGLLGGDVGDLKNAFPIIQYYAARVIAIPPGDREHPLAWIRYDFDSERDAGAAIINTANLNNRIVYLMDAGATATHLHMVRENKIRHTNKTYPVPELGITYRYIADRQGRLAYAFNSDNGRRVFLRFEGNSWVTSPIDLETIDVFGPGNDPGTLVVLAPNGDGKPYALRVMDGATGALGETLLNEPEYDFEGHLYRRPSTGEVIGVQYDRSGPKSVWFDAKYAAIQKLIDASFPGLVSKIVSSDDAETIFLIASYSDRQPVKYNWVKPAERSAGLFNDTAPWIDASRMQPMNVIKFKTRDGRSLDAYLTMPAGATKENPPPLIVLPHGGPWVRDVWGFDREVQFLASRGYAVLQPNYRGSPGYNWMFPSKDQWDFIKMHEDVTDATKLMARSGLIDPDRIAIMGGSFGGYLAISGVVNDPDLYRCAVTIAGVFDWEKSILHDKDDRFDSPQYGRMLYALGDPDKEPEKFEAISVGRRAGSIKVPVFVAGGKADRIVEIAQSKRLLATLESNNVPHESFFVRTEGHGMSRVKNQVELYSRIEEFLAKNLAKRN